MIKEQFILLQLCGQLKWPVRRNESSHPSLGGGEGSSGDLCFHMPYQSSAKDRSDMIWQGQKSAYMLSGKLALVKC